MAQQTIESNQADYSWLYYPDGRQYTALPEEHIPGGEQFKVLLVTSREVPVEQAHLALVEEAREARELAFERGEDYSLAHNSAENIMTMMKAVLVYGPDVATAFNVDPHKVEISHQQLDDVLAYRVGHQRFEVDSVDAATYMLTALSLARMAEVDADEATRTVALWAIDGLRQVPEIEEDVKSIMNPEELQQVEQARSMESWAGDIAASAVVERYLVGADL